MAAILGYLVVMHASDRLTRPTQLSGRSWWRALKRSGKNVGEHNLTTWAAALTYYAVLSIFPGLLVLISVLRLMGQHTMRSVLDYIESTAPGPVRQVLGSAIDNLKTGQGSTAGILVVVGVLAALWSASGYVGSFMQAANAVYEVPERRPFWKKVPLRLAITIVAGVVVGGSALAAVLTGSLARRAGNAIGLGSQAVTIWDIAKWPVLVILISLLFSLLYWAAPNTRQGFRWVTPGSMLAVVVWIAASAGFAFYVTNFGSYNKVYGTVAAVIIFLVWLWISNLAILFGAEFDAQLQRARPTQTGS